MVQWKFKSSLVFECFSFKIVCTCIGMNLCHTLHLSFVYTWVFVLTFYSVCIRTSVGSHTLQADLLLYTQVLCYTEFQVVLFITSIWVTYKSWIPIWDCSLLLKLLIKYFYLEWIVHSATWGEMNSINKEEILYQCFFIVFA